MEKADVRAYNKVTGKYEYYRFAEGTDRFVALDSDGIPMYENDTIQVMRWDAASGAREIPVQGTLKMSPGAGAYYIAGGRAHRLSMKRGWAGRMHCKRIDIADSTPFIKVETGTSE